MLEKDIYSKLFGNSQMINVNLNSICSNLLEKTTDAVIKAAKNGDLIMVSDLKIGWPDLTFVEINFFVDL